MENTLAVARRAVEADSAQNWAEAVRLYLQAASELEAFAAAAQADGSRTAEEVAAIRAKATEYRARGTALQAPVCPLPPGAPHD